MLISNFLYWESVPILKCYRTIHLYVQMIESLCKIIQLKGMQCQYRSLVLAVCSLRVKFEDTFWWFVSLQWFCFSYWCFFSSQGSRDHSWPAFLWSHRHVVAGMCDSWALLRLAPLPRSPWVWPGNSSNMLHLSSPVWTSLTKPAQNHWWYLSNEI